MTTTSIKAIKLGTTATQALEAVRWLEKWDVEADYIEQAHSIQIHPVGETPLLVKMDGLNWIVYYWRTGKVDIVADAELGRSTFVSVVE